MRTVLGASEFAMIVLDLVCDAFWSPTARKAASALGTIHLAVFRLARQT